MKKPDELSLIPLHTRAQDSLNDVAEVSSNAFFSVTFYSIHYRLNFPS